MIETMTANQVANDTYKDRRWGAIMTRVRAYMNRQTFTMERG